MRIRQLLSASLMLWLVVVMYLSYSELSSQSGQSELEERLAMSTNELHTLRQQRQQWLGLQTQLNRTHMDERTGKEGPSLAHELVRRKVDGVSQEFWFFIRSELKKLTNIHNVSSDKPLDVALNKLLTKSTDYQRTLRTDFHKLANGVDNLTDWRFNQSMKLGDLVQRRLKYLQNPKDCKNARKLVCRMNKGCGFGCLVHHGVYCLIMAYNTERTMILDDDRWTYKKAGPWASTFQKLSETCTTDGGKNRTKYTPESAADARTLILLPTLDMLKPRPKYLPLAVPEDLADRILRFHGNPAAWWIGQLMKYLLRLQSHVLHALAQKRDEMGFETPIVGVHIRRTDKLKHEAKLYEVEQYMEHVEEWFSTYERRHPGVTRRIFLATDEPTVIREVLAKYPRYTVVSDNSVSESATLKDRYSALGLKGIVQDIHFLSLTNFLVCTFSSQVCRAAYEIMQTMHGDASQNFKSLDDIYYYGGQNAHNVEAIEANIPDGDKRQLKMEPGELVGIAGNHWDGYSKGTNTRTNQKGLFPSYKAVDTVVRVKMPTYPEVLESS